MLVILKSPVSLSVVMYNGLLNWESSRFLKSNVTPHFDKQVVVAKTELALKTKIFTALVYFGSKKY